MDKIVRFTHSFTIFCEAVFRLAKFNNCLQRKLQFSIKSEGPRDMCMFEKEFQGYEWQELNRNVSVSIKSKLRGSLVQSNTC